MRYFIYFLYIKKKLIKIKLELNDVKDIHRDITHTHELTTNNTISSNESGNYDTRSPVKSKRYVKQEADELLSASSSSTTSFKIRPCDRVSITNESARKSANHHKTPNQKLDKFSARPNHFKYTHQACIYSFPLNCSIEINSENKLHFDEKQKLGRLSILLQEIASLAINIFAETHNLKEMQEDVPVIGVFSPSEETALDPVDKLKQNITEYRLLSAKMLKEIKSYINPETGEIQNGQTSKFSSTKTKAELVTVYDELAASQERFLKTLIGMDKQNTSSMTNQLAQNKREKNQVDTEIVSEMSENLLDGASKTVTSDSTLQTPEQMPEFSSIFVRYKQPKISEYFKQITKNRRSTTENFQNKITNNNESSTKKKHSEVQDLTNPNQQLRSISDASENLIEFREHSKIPEEEFNLSQESKTNNCTSDGTQSEELFPLIDLTVDELNSILSDLTSETDSHSSISNTQLQNEGIQQQKSLLETQIVQEPKISILDQDVVDKSLNMASKECLKRRHKSISESFTIKEKEILTMKSDVSHSLISTSVPVTLSKTCLNHALPLTLTNKQTKIPLGLSSFNVQSEPNLSAQQNLKQSSLLNVQTSDDEDIPPALPKMEKLKIESMLGRQQPLKLCIKHQHLAQSVLSTTQENSFLKTSTPRSSPTHAMLSSQIVEEVKPVSEPQVIDPAAIPPASVRERYLSKIERFKAQRKKKHIKSRTFIQKEPLENLPVHVTTEKIPERTSCAHEILIAFRSFCAGAFKTLEYSEILYARKVNRMTKLKYLGQNDTIKMISKQLFKNEITMATLQKLVLTIICWKSGPFEIALDNAGIKDSFKFMLDMQPKKD